MSPPSGSITALPPEVRDLLLGYLTPAMARPLACASRLWREQVVHCGAVWRGRLEARFPLTAARLQRAEARLREAQGGYLAYHEGTNYAEAMKVLPRLNQMAYGRVISHPDSEVTRKGFFSRLAASVASSMPRWVQRGHPERFLVVGLDAAGKTTICDRLTRDEFITTIPTIGYFESFQHKGIKMVCVDLGGDRRGGIWRHIFENTDGVIFVVDATDRDRIDTTEQELGRMLSELQLLHRPLLIFANKQDLPGAAMPEEIAMRLRRPLQLVEATGAVEPSSRPWCVQGCSGLKGEGLADGFDWLVAACRALAPAAR